MDCYTPSPSARTKGNWSAEEDRRLARLVQEHGEGTWSFIARHFAGRIGKQCRERWHNQLRPDIKRDAWDDEEEQLLIEAHQKLGNKWSDIAKLIPGRTENAVKNHWNATLRRKDSAGVDGQGRPLTRLKHYMKSAAAGNRRRGNRNNRSIRKDKRSGRDGGDIAEEDVKRQRLYQDPAAGGGGEILTRGPHLAGTERAQLQAPFLDLPFAPREEMLTSFILPTNTPHRHSSNNSESDQLLDWLTNSAAVGAGGGAGETTLGALDYVSALKFPFNGDTSFPNHQFPPFHTTAGQGGLTLGGGREIFCTPEPPMLASPLISPSSGLGYPTFMHALVTNRNIEHPALHSYNNLPAIPNPLRPSSFGGGERSKSAASSRSAAPIQGANTAAGTLMNVPISKLGINRATPSSLSDEGAGFFSPPPSSHRKGVAHAMGDQQPAAEDTRQGRGGHVVKSRQVAPHAFLSPDSATSPAS